MAYNNSLIDKRVVDRNIAKGLVDPEQLKAQIEALPDVEGNCVKIVVDGTRIETVDDSASYDDDSEDEDEDEDDEDDDEESDEG